MSKSARYETGTKAQVLVSMAQYAIRDQRALMDAYTPSFGELDEAAQAVVDECKARIRDYQKILRSLKMPKS